MSLEFEYPHRETLIGGDDIRNEIVTLVYPCTCFFNV